MTTKLLTGIGRLSYASLLKARKGTTQGAKERYSVMLMLPKDDKKTIEAIKKAIMAEVAEGAKKQWGGEVPDDVLLPLKCGDGTSLQGDGTFARDAKVLKSVKKNEMLKDYYWINASSNAFDKDGDARPRPYIIKGSEEGKRLTQNGETIHLTSDQDVYSGCWGRLSVNLVANPEIEGNTSVGCYLNGTMVTKKDERLGGGSTAESDFDEEEDIESEDEFTEESEDLLG